MRGGLFVLREGDLGAGAAKGAAADLEGFGGPRLRADRPTDRRPVGLLAGCKLRYASCGADQLRGRFGVAPGKETPGSASSAAAWPGPRGRKAGAAERGPERGSEPELRLTLLAAAVRRGGLRLWRTPPGDLTHVSSLPLSLSPL